MQQRLQDVMIMRPLAIVLMIVWHSFIIYTGGWREPAGFERVSTYWWIAQLSYAFMLELFVFVSGYVFAITLNKEGVTFKGVIISKFKRLIVPSLIFSTLYFVLLGNKSGSVFKVMYDIVNGYGHFWFLPMLFWATLFCYALDRVKLPQWIKVAIVVCLLALSILPIPLRIGTACYYTAFFYAGIVAYRNRAKLLKFINGKRAIELTMLFCCLFLAKSYIEQLPPPYTSNPLIIRGVVAELEQYIRFIVAAVGVTSVYALTNRFIVGRNFEAPAWLVEINSACFGIYVFQQFILQILYYKTTLPSLVGPYWLPWIGFFVALLGSYMLTKIIRSSKLGRTVL